MTHPTLALGMPLVGLLLATGCHGDWTSSTGEFGKLTYALATDYEGQQDELTELPLITGYEHHVHVDLTKRGEKQAGKDVGLITHRASGARVSTADPDEERTTVSSFSILAANRGDVTVESMLEDELFDRITLQFDDPSHLDLVTWHRAPWDEDWDDQLGTSPLTLREGAQISFLAIPMADDVRLGGNFTPQIDVDPPDLVVPDDQVYAVQEGGVTTGGEPVTFFAIEPGTVTFTLSDPVHGVDVVQTVEILPY